MKLWFGSPVGWSVAARRSSMLRKNKAIAFTEFAVSPVRWALGLSLHNRFFGFVVTGPFRLEKRAGVSEEEERG